MQDLCCMPHGCGPCVQPGLALAIQLSGAGAASPDEEFVGSKRS